MKTPIRKSTLPHGPWTDEADELAWEHRGLPCVVVRGPWWSFNGYVGIHVGHPLFGLHYNDESPKLVEFVERLNSLRMDSPKVGFSLMLSALGGGAEPEPGQVLQVHGGVTYAGEKCPDDPLKRTGLWWFGFDTGHYRDFAPGLYFIGQNFDYFRENSVYRDLAYVKKETEDLARQLAELDQLSN